MGVKESLGKLKSRYEWEKSKMEAKGLRRLRNKRMKLEGKALRSSLKQKELGRIEKAQKTLSKGKRKKSNWTMFGEGSGGWDFGLEKTTKRKKKEEWTI